MPTEADTCRTLTTPKLQAAAWESDPHSMTEQYSFTEGQIQVHGNEGIRGPRKRADCLLRYRRDFPIAVVEAKTEDAIAAKGLQQAKECAEILKLKFAYSTNGAAIVEFDYTTGLERAVPSFPTPAELCSEVDALKLFQAETAVELDALLPAILGRAFKGEL